MCLVFNYHRCGETIIHARCLYQVFCLVHNVLPRKTVTRVY